MRKRFPPARAISGSPEADKSPYLASRVKSALIEEANLLAAKGEDGRSLPEAAETLSDDSLERIAKWM